MGMHRSRQLIARLLTEVTQGTIAHVYYKSEATLAFAQPENGFLVGGSEQNTAMENGLQADREDAPEDKRVRTEAAHLELHLIVLFQVQDQRQGRCDVLSHHSRSGSSRDPELRSPEQAEDQDGVHDDVEDGAGHLGYHGIKCPAGGLQDAFQGHFHKEAQGTAADDAHIDVAVGADVRVGGLDVKEGLCQKQADQHEGGHDQQLDEDAVDSALVDVFEVLLAQGAGEKGVDADRQSHCKGDHKSLDGEGEADSGQGVLTDHRHEDGVHDVVEGLNHHGEHHGDGHGGQEPSHRHGSHFVFFYWCGMRHDPDPFSRGGSFRPCSGGRFYCNQYTSFAHVQE